MDILLLFTCRVLLSDLGTLRIFSRDISFMEHLGTIAFILLDDVTNHVLSDSDVIGVQEGHYILHTEIAISLMGC